MITVNFSKAYPIIALGGTLLLTACSGTPVKQGLVDGALAICGDKPNCVSSQDKREDHYIAPLSYPAKNNQAISLLQNYLEKQENVNINDITENYIWAVYTTPLMQFNDDVEFYFSQPGTIQIRSASRIGYSDLGANNKRVEGIRTDFQKQTADRTIEQ